MWTCGSDANSTTSDESQEPIAIRWSMDLLATWLTAVQSVWRQALTLRWPYATIPIHGMMMRFHWSSRGTDNFDETTTALVSTMTRAATTHPHRNMMTTTWLWVATLIRGRSSSGGLFWWANQMSQRSGIDRLLWRVTSMSQRSSKDQAVWWAILYCSGATRSSDFYIDSGRWPLCHRGAAKTKLSGGWSLYCLLLSWTDFYGELNLIAIACDIDFFVEPIFQVLLTYLVI